MPGIATTFTLVVKGSVMILIDERYELIILLSFPAPGEELEDNPICPKASPEALPPASTEDALSFIFLWSLSSKFRPSNPPKSMFVNFM